jgi:transposase
LKSSVTRSECASQNIADPIALQVVFDATPTHERDGPEAFLAGLRAICKRAYTGYDALYASSRIREIGCWAHARRGFVEALSTDVRAALIVALIRQLYDVERAGAELSAEARHDLRHKQSMPLLDKIAAERDHLAQTVLPKSPRVFDVPAVSTPRVGGRPGW